MKHLVIGAGNLGLDLQKEILSRGEECAMLTRSEGFNYPCIGGYENRGLPFPIDHIWCTVGAGSVEDAKKDFLPFLQLHVMLPVSLAQAVREMKSKLHLFSTDYLCEMGNEKPRSLYALSKKMMEDAVLYLPMELLDRVHIWRVGSLYGEHKPLKTFPGKVMRALLKKEPVELPINECRPTPTAWLAKRLLDLKDGVPMHWHYHWLSPRNSSSSYSWGTTMFGERRISSRGVDHDRPIYLEENADSAYEPNWEELWLQYGPATLAAAEKELARETT